MILSITNIFKMIGLRASAFIIIVLSLNIGAQTQLTGLVITGDTRSTSGATWTYQATRDTVTYNLTGVLLYPQTGTAPFPAVVISHGKGGNTGAYTVQIGKKMRNWGLVVVGVNYTHAANVAVGLPGDTTKPGASEANMLRGRICLDILQSLGDVDMNRVAAHGHSMGAYVTAALAGTTPERFLVASHTAGGVGPVDGFAATSRSQARGIAVPYQMHHGDLDSVVLLSSDQRLDSLLQTTGVEHELKVYAGYRHPDMAQDSLMLERVKKWYTDHGLFDNGTSARNCSLQAFHRQIPSASVWYDLHGRVTGFCKVKNRQAGCLILGTSGKKAQVKQAD